MTPAPSGEMRSDPHGGGEPPPYMMRVRRGALDIRTRTPTRLSPACCRPWTVEGPSAPDDAAPCVGGRWGVRDHAGTFPPLS